MIILVGTIILIGTVPLVRGDLRRLATLPIRHLWLVWLAIIAQTIAVTWDIPVLGGRVVHLVTYALAAAFVIVNSRVPGIVLIGVGGALNAAAIVANGGVMPAAPAALRAAGLVADGGFANSAAVDDARLAWLGDVFAIPSGWPLANVFSIGDVILVAGVGFLVHIWCRTGQPHRSPAQTASTEPF